MAKGYGRGENEAYAALAAAGGLRLRVGPCLRSFHGHRNGDLSRRCRFEQRGPLRPRDLSNEGSAFLLGPLVRWRGGRKTGCYPILEISCIPRSGRTMESLIYRHVVVSD
jgi:hypothetical protein